MKTANEYSHIIKSLEICIQSLNYQTAPTYTPETIEEARADLKANLGLAIDMIREAGL